jgi:pSer/pThr/pTyr-binding forkhead associated (FHA) protein
MRCGECQHENIPGALFCDECGAGLGQVAVEPGPPPPAGQMVLKAAGQVIPLPDKAEVILGREDPVSGIFPDVDLTPLGADEKGVSRRHARITREDSGYRIEDLGSTNATAVNRNRLMPREAVALNPGDEIRLGKMAMSFEEA